MRDQVDIEIVRNALAERQRKCWEYAHLHLLSRPERDRMADEGERIERLKDWLDTAHFECEEGVR